MLQILCFTLEIFLSHTPFKNTETYPISTSSLAQFDSVKNQPI